MDFRSLPKYTGPLESVDWVEWRLEARKDDYGLLRACGLLAIIVLPISAYFAFKVLAAFPFFNPFIM
jgi:hypothetical protein